MSNGGELVWVSDIDGYIDIDAINHSHELEQKELQLQAELEEIGTIRLLAGKMLSADALNARGISPAEWRWALHEAERALHEDQGLDGAGARFVRQLISLGQRYAVGRYAKWERLSYEAALISTLPLGFRALLDFFLRAAGLSECSGKGSILPEALKAASSTPGMTAYERTGLIQSAIHEIAREAFGPSGHQRLDRESMRTLLSLARLHFSAAELKAIGGLDDLRDLDQLYATARRDLEDESLRAPPVGGRRIKNWRSRHLYPLPHLFPYSVRYALARALQEPGGNQASPERSVLVNELALAQASLRLMRRVSADAARRR